MLQLTFWYKAIQNYYRKLKFWNPLMTDDRFFQRMYQFKAAILR